MRHFGLIFLLFLSLSCSRYEQAGEEDQFRQIQTQIDRKEYSKAEKQLRDILSAEPNNQRARVILASIFVSQAGITLKDYFALEKLSHLNSEPGKTLVDLKSFEKMDLPEDSQFKKTLQFLGEINLVAGHLQEISDKFEQVTVVDDSGAEYLRQALQELEQVQNIEDGNALYRGVIKLYYFKYLWKTGNLLSFGERKFCSQEVTKLANRLNFIGLYTLGMVQDVARGFPQVHEQFQEQIGNVDRDFKEAQSSLASLKNPGRSVKEITEKFAKDQSIKGFECDF